MITHYIELAITIVIAVLGSSGLWAYIQKKADSKDARTRMLIGLGHDRIMSLGVAYIERGYITRDELENLHDYLYKPYEMIGGNGTAKRVMEGVMKLPIKEHHEEKKN